MLIFRGALLLSFLAVTIAGPVKRRDHDLSQQQNNEINTNDHKTEAENIEFAIEYGRYLKEVVQTLESDQTFRKKLEAADADEIKSGKIAKELHFVDHNVRTKLDELKRSELERLRHLATKEQEKKLGIDRNRLKIPDHLDHLNPDKFEIEDLRKLIKEATKDLQIADEQRHEDFKKYEMEKEFEYKEKLEHMTLEEKQKEEQKHEEQIKKHKQHPKLHHPGSKQQLEEVWEEQDHMNGQDFDPRTFFQFHDLDGNGFWDENEVKTLFLKELDKMYDPNAPEDDLEERHEEMERMREHIFKEADTNMDDLISFEEFLEQTRKDEFNRDQGWDGLDDQEIFSQQEYEQFQQQRRHEMEAAGMPNEINRQPIAGQVHQQQFGQVPQHQQVPQQQFGQVPQHQQVPQQQFGQVPQHQQAPQQQFGQVPQHQQVPQQQFGQVPQQPQVPQQQHPQVPQQQQPQVPQQQQPQVPQQQQPQVPQQQQPQVPQQQQPQVPQQQQPQVPQQQQPQVPQQQQQQPQAPQQQGIPKQ